MDYIHKPFSSAVVKARVHTHLVLRGIREQLSHQLTAIRNELETARQIQLSILPGKMPTTNNLNLAARYLPMTEVAGDFYDFIIVDDNHLGVLIADVSGHGMPAALISSMLKIALASQSAFASDPAQVLSGLNQALCGKFQGHFVTAAYVFIDMENNILHYAGAGHPPLITKNNVTSKVAEILENGLFLGAFPHATYTSVKVPLRQGTGVFSTQMGSWKLPIPMGKSSEQTDCSCSCKTTNGATPIPLSIGFLRRYVTGRISPPIARQMTTLPS